MTATQQQGVAAATHGCSSDSKLPEEMLMVDDNRERAMTVIHVAWDSARCSKHNKTADLRMTEIACRTTKTRQSTDSTKAPRNSMLPEEMLILSDNRDMAITSTSAFSKTSCSFSSSAAVVGNGSSGAAAAYAHKVS